ncbi:MAG: hypothetical protein ACK5B7_07700 [Novosphingobium sp.]
MDRILGDSTISVHVLYRIGIAIEGEALILREQPPGCAARLLVKSHRQVERLNQICKIDADAGRRLVAAERFTQAILAAPQFEQQRIVLVRAPGLSVSRGARSHNAERRPKQGGDKAQRWEVAPHDVSFRFSLSVSSAQRTTEVISAIS